MAVNDLITRLILQTKEFDGNLQRSQKEMKNFQKEISKKVGDVSKGFSSAIGVVGKLAPAIGIAAGGVEAFKKTVGATQSTQDAFNRTIEQSKTGVDVFFESVARSDFSNFINTMNDAITAAGNFYDALDELQTRQIHANAELSAIAADEAAIRASIKQTRLNIEKSSSIAEKTMFQATLKALEGMLTQSSVKQGVIYANLHENAYNAFSASLKKQLRTQVDNDALVLDYIKTSNRDKLKEDAAYYKEQADLAKGQLEYTGTAVGIRVEVEGTKEALKWLESEEAQRKKIAYLINESADDLESTLNYYKQANEFSKKQSENVERNATQELELLGINKQKTNSLKSSVEAQKELYELYGSLIKKADEFRISMAKASEAGDIAGVVFYKNELSKVQQKIDDLKKLQRQGVSGAVGPGAESLAVPGISVPKVQGFDLSKENENIQAWSVSIGQLGESGKGLEDLVTGLGEVANAASAISDNPAIRALASSLMILQGVQKLASATTWVEYVVGGISVAAAVASMASTFSNMNKFAGGGVVGDQNLVRINSGEMILNHAQQSRLFNTLNSGRMDNDAGGQVQFVIRGQDLVGVQKNHNSKFGKNGSNY